MKLVSRILVLFGLLATIQAQNVNINCNFFHTGGFYTCFLIEINIPDNINANFIIGGQHLAGFNNANVQQVQVFASNMHFIVTQFFTTFPNLSRFFLSHGGLNRIQSNAFANAQFLIDIFIFGNPNLTQLHSNAFTGAANLDILTLDHNAIETIHETAFAGVNRIRSFEIGDNRLRTIRFNQFHTMPLLQRIAISDNLLETLDGRLLSHTPQVTFFLFARNQVKSIGRNIFDNVPNIEVINGNDNVCTDGFWVIGDIHSIESIRRDLATCFDNFDQLPELRRFILHLQGTVVITDDNGTEIVRL